MQYTTILTHQPGTLWQAFVPVLPDCHVKGTTRDEVLDKITSRIEAISLHMEVLQLQIPARQEADKAQLEADTNVLTEAPWDWVGFFDDDPSWPQLFDDIEERRNQHLIGGPEDGTEQIRGLTDDLS